jgi:radical SAM superfamily enzyme YgiQ (UPF0313 family)
MTKNKVLLLFPSTGHGIPARPPLGILTIAGPLLEAGYNVKFIDERCHDDFDERVLNELTEELICVGISSMSGRHLKNAQRISSLVKENSSAPVVFGGVQASLAPESTIKSDLVDIIIRDDGEEIFPILVEHLKNNRSLANVLGIAFKEEGKIIFTDPAPPADIANLPPIPFHLADLTKYNANRSWAKGLLFAIETSRGCPFSCTFCTESVRKKKWRSVSAERTVELIKHYIKTYNVRNFTFIDDYLFGDPRRGEKIIDLLLAENIKINWYTNMRADYMAKVSSSFIKKLEQAGCCELTFGAESGSNRILKMIQKGAKVEDILKTNRKLARSSIKMHFVTIQGFPTETKKEIKKTYLLNVTLLLRKKNALCDMPHLIPTPSTKIAEQCLGAKAADFTMEDWSNIFDLIKHSKPEWILDETYEFIQKHKYISLFLQYTNKTPEFSSSIPKRKILLILIKISLLFNFSVLMDKFISRYVEE